MDNASTEGAARPLQPLLDAVLAFRDARDWQQFHTLPDLLVSLSLECAEALEVVQWRTRQGHDLQLDDTQREHLGEELADVLAYLLVAAHKADIDLAAAFFDKLQKNAIKYPVATSHGRSDKYHDLPTNDPC